jgi:8-oxo-dGTP diphosphatase
MTHKPDPEFERILRPGVAVDVVLLTVMGGELKVALITRQDEPYFGKHALPGRFVRYDERITDTARLALETKGRIDARDVYLEQLHTFGDNLVRDTRIRTISIVYYGLVDSAIITEQEENRFVWTPAYALPPLAFDHAHIIEASIARIRDKLFTTDLVFNLVPKEFTLSQLQRTYEILLATPLDKRNFRKRIEETYLLKDCKKQHREGAHRPAALYQYVKMR